METLNLSANQSALSSVAIAIEEALTEQESPYYKNVFQGVSLDGETTDEAQMVRLFRSSGLRKEVLRDILLMCKTSDIDGVTRQEFFKMLRGVAMAQNNVAKTDYEGMLLSPNFGLLPRFENIPFPNVPLSDVGRGLIGEEEDQEVVRFLGTLKLNANGSLPEKDAKTLSKTGASKASLKSIWVVVRQNNVAGKKHKGLNPLQVYLSVLLAFRSLKSGSVPTSLDTQLVQEAQAALQNSQQQGGRVPKPSLGSETPREDPFFRTSNAPSKSMNLMQEISAALGNPQDVLDLIGSLIKQQSDVAQLYSKEVSDFQGSFGEQNEENTQLLEEALNLISEVNHGMEKRTELRQEIDTEMAGIVGVLDDEALQSQLSHFKKFMNDKEGEESTRACLNNIAVALRQEISLPKGDAARMGHGGDARLDEDEDDEGFFD